MAGSRQQRAEGRGGGHERARLIRQDLQVEVHAIRAARRAEGLIELALTQTLERARVVRHHLGAQRSHQQRRSGEKDVARQDRAVIAPQVLSRGHAATRGRRIHDVVVVQGCQVRELNRRRSSDDLLVERTLGLAQLRAHEGEQFTLERTARHAGAEQASVGGAIELMEIRMLRTHVFEQIVVERNGFHRI